MKNKFLGITLVSLLLCSCNKGYVDLSNYNIKNYSSLVSIGYAVNSKKNTKSKNKKLLNVKQDNEENNNIKTNFFDNRSSFVRSKEPFTMIGMNNDGVLDAVTAIKGENEVDIPLSVLQDVGNYFIINIKDNYCVADNVIEEYYFSYDKIKYTSFEPQAFTEGCYIISKETGKIYDPSFLYKNYRVNWGYVTNKDVFVTLFEKDNWGENSDYCVKLEEFDDQLHFTSFDFLAKIRYKDTFYNSDIYSNFCVFNDYDKTDYRGIVDSTGTIHDFKDLINNGYKIICDNIVHRIYCVNSEGNYKILNSNCEFEEVEKVGINNAINEEGFEISKYDLMGLQDHYSNYGDHTYILSSGKQVIKNNGKTYLITPINEYLYDAEILTLPYTQKGNEPIFLNDSFYILNSNKKIIKLNIETKETKEIVLDNVWEVSEFYKDSFNRIVVKGRDYNFNDFIGYLTEDDEVVDTIIENNGFKDYALNPIN